MTFFHSELCPFLLAILMVQYCVVPGIQMEDLEIKKGFSYTDIWVPVFNLNSPLFSFVTARYLDITGIFAYYLMVLSLNRCRLLFFPIRSEPSMLPGIQAILHPGAWRT